MNTQETHGGVVKAKNAYTPVVPSDGKNLYLKDRWLEGVFLENASYEGHRYLSVDTIHEALLLSTDGLIKSLL